MKRNPQGLNYMTAILLGAKSELSSQGHFSEHLRNVLLCTFGSSDYSVLSACFLVGEEKEPNSDSIGSNGEDADNVQIAIAIIDRQLKALDLLKQHALESSKLEVEAETRSLSLPSQDATDKLLRYEAHLDRQLYRAMDQLERLQRQRKGEKIPPPLNINLGRRN